MKEGHELLGGPEIGSQGVGLHYVACPVELVPGGTRGGGASVRLCHGSVAVPAATAKARAI